MPSRYELWYGRNEPPVEVRHLRAGAVSAQLHGMDLRYVKTGDVEVVRRIYVAVRDHNWRTIPGVCSHMELDVADDHFAIGFDVRHRERAIDFSWHGLITGSADGTITYAMEGVAASDFRYNRIGLCILHPPETAAGRPYRAETPGGPINGVLPLLIGPQRIVDGTFCALFPAVSRLIIDATDDLSVRFDFEGDLFEMEDQRNWTDNSFKTYCTPLALPWPKDAHAGQTIGQKVVITCAAAQTAAASDRARGATVPASSPAAVRVTLGSALGTTLPPIGLGMASHGQPLSARDVALLKPLRLSHLRADLHLHDPAHVAELDRAAQACAALGCRLELALFVTDAADDELGALAPRLQSCAPIARILVFHEREESTAGRWVRLARERLQSVAPDALFAGGTNAYFTELNRTQPDIAAMDAVSYTLNPQVHAFDEPSLAETVQAQADTVRTARAFCNGRPVIVSPITLKPRYNANATEPEPPPGPGELPSAVDPRQMSLFGAAWTLGSVKYLAESGAAALTYYETTGWRGVMETEAGSPPDLPFPSRPGMVFPLYHVFADLAEWPSGNLVACRSSDPLTVDGMAVRAADGLHVMLANMMPQEQSIIVGPIAAARVAVRCLDEQSAPVALFEPGRFRSTSESMDIASGQLTVTLAPFAVARLDAPQ
jgi:hypothetical protein